MQVFSNIFNGSFLLVRVIYPLIGFLYQVSNILSYTLKLPVMFETALILHSLNQS